MTSSSTPSPISDGQIEKLLANVRAVLVKHRHRYSVDNFQEALRRGRLDTRVTTAVETALEQAIFVVSNTTVCIVPKLDRGRDPWQVINAADRTPYATSRVVMTMPSGGSGVKENVEVVFFRLGREVSDEELVREFAMMGLTPDPYAQSAVNEADPVFADKYPNATQWKSANGEWCYMLYHRLHGERAVAVTASDHQLWGSYWWFCGTRKRVDAQTATISRQATIHHFPTRLVKYEDEIVAVPHSGSAGESVTVEFFKLGRKATDDEVASEYEKLGLVPDLRAQSAVNEADPTFTNQYPNALVLKTDKGRWLCVVFRHINGVHHTMAENEEDGTWDDYWWFGGVRKPASDPAQQ